MAQRTIGLAAFAHGQIDVQFAVMAAAKAVWPASKTKASWAGAGKACCCPSLCADCDGVLSVESDCKYRRNHSAIA